MLKHIQKGFTLIELMIVVAIIGILAAIAIPAYQDYTIRAQVTEGLSLATGIKTAIADYYANTGQFPVAGVTTAASAQGLGFTGIVQGKYGTADVAAGGVIQITYDQAQVNQKINGQILGIAAGGSPNGDLIWVCGNAAVPAAATNPKPAATGTTITNSQYLPSSCR